MINYLQRTGSIHKKWSMYAGTHFTDPRKDGKLSELYRERRSHKCSTLDQAEARTGDLRIGRQRS